MIDKLMKAMHRLYGASKDQRGMTGLETAIILIAFVTVAAVFGYAVLSAGIFSAEKGKETVYAGLEQAKSSMELKGSVIAYGAPGGGGTINDCKDATTAGWDDTVAGVTAATTTGWDDTGDGAIQFSIGGAAGDFSAGLVGSDAVATGPTEPMDLSEENCISLYIKTDTDTEAGDVKLLLYHEGLTPSMGNGTETLDLPALSSEDDWRPITLTLADPALDDAIANVGLVYLKDVAAADLVVISIDDIIVGAPYDSVYKVEFTLANAIAGRPIDLTEPKDNATVISYQDSYTYEEDVLWTVSFIGQNDGDNLLEPGEQAAITVPLSFGTPVGPYDTFCLQVKPPHGSVITIERTIPANIDPVIDLY